MSFYYIMNLLGDDMKKINNKGFTLIEVLAVIAIITLLGIFTIPSVLSSMGNSKNSSYKILIENIKTAGTELYEELEFAGSILSDYNSKGQSTANINLSGNSVTVTLQGLVNNGFLKGSNNSSDNSTNTNSKILLNPKNNQDLGTCSIIITKIKTGDKICYEIKDNSNNNICPKSTEYGSCSSTEESE